MLWQTDVTMYVMVIELFILIILGCYNAWKYYNECGKMLAMSQLEPVMYLCCAFKYLFK